MSGVTQRDLNTLIAAFPASGGYLIVPAVSLPDARECRHPAALAAGCGAVSEGDIGVRHFIDTSGLEVKDVEIGDRAHLDVADPDAVIAAVGV